MAADIIKPKLPSGVMELLPREQAAFQRMLDTIRRTYERYGFIGLDTPVFELKDVLLTKSGGDTEKQVYLVQSSGAEKQGYEADMALRFDLTVPLARYVAQNERELAFPFRRYHIAKVYRGESAQRGRYREFYQCDIDVVGKDNLSLAADAEMPAVISTLFRELGVGAFTIRMSNRKLLQGLLAGVGVTDGDRRAEVVRTIDKMDKLGRDGVLAALGRLDYVTEDAVAAIGRFLDVRGPVDEVLRGLAALDVADPTYTTGVAELTEVVAEMDALAVPRQDYTIDTTIARGLDYYTGTVYETILNVHPEVGSVCSGGRYDNLATLYTKAVLPGVGISIGATRLFFQLQAAGLLGQPRGFVDVMFAELDPAIRGRCHELARDLRAAGVSTFVWTEGHKMKKQMTFADKAGVPFVVFLGGDELAAGVAKVKSLTTGSQTDVPLADLTTHLVRALGR